MFYYKEEYTTIFWVCQQFFMYFLAQINDKYIILYTIGYSILDTN